jgi:maltose O-acetyltransferase
MARAPFVGIGLRLGFQNIGHSYVHGDPSKVHMGTGCSIVTTTFNVSSGHIWIGDDTLLSHGCQVLTGEHRFYNGRRASLSADAPYSESPTAGNDIRIGAGCFIGAGSIITGGVTIGDNVIVGAGSVVTRDLPSGYLATGAPATPVRSV